MRESKFQRDFIVALRDTFPDCVILKNDSSYLQGVPDLLLLWGDRWAMLEIKARADAPYQPNQEYYIDVMNNMSFAAVVHPDNEQDVLDALQQTFGSRR